MAVARELERKGERPVRILASPLRRAVQTADIVAAVLGGAVEVRGELAPSEAAPDIVNELMGGDDERVLVVGHAPDVSILAAELLGEGGRSHSFEPGMVVAVDLTPGRPAAEHFVIRPSALE
jgi:phosphohistidine phosphatase